MTNHSFQLYSVRNFNLDDVLAQLSSAGIKEVEGFGPLYENVAEMRAKLDAHGLRMATGHFALDMIENDPERAIEIARGFGMDAVIVPFLMPDERPADYEGWLRFGERLAKAGQPIVEAGFDFGWHNHDFEFKADEGGQLPQDAILSGAEFVKLELDLAWVLVAGHDPIEMLECYKDRLIAVHAKDRAPDGENADEDGWADLGHGQMNWSEIGAKLKALGVKRAVLEHDNPSDAKRFIANSLPTLQSL